ncbi:hypothetical protein [uncultured Corynebacterium sp.]|uniref:hypothetical protein n=1 Tax=uncultured Corynebacterium sp. TaxID=159447 RepID=UPI0028ED4498|nr:hypothetical protein [uncultured Corynebacterium sp.]
MMLYDDVFSPELIAAINSASAQMGPFELTRQFLYFYMSERGIFDDEMWGCVRDLSESSFGDANYSDRLDQLYEKYAFDYYSDESDLDPRKEPERWNKVVVGVKVSNSLSCGLRDSMRNLPFHACYNILDFVWDVEEIHESIKSLDYAFRLRYGLPPELVAEIDTATAKFGLLGFTKKFLFSHLLDHGIHSGEVWDCVAELPESSCRDSSYIGRLERLSKKYDEDYYSNIDYKPEQLKTLVARMSVIDSILHGLDKPIAEFPYHACYAMLDSRWYFGKLLEKVKSLE